MIYAAISFGILLLIAPIAIKARLFISFKDKKIYYSLFLYEKLRINSGYVRYKNKYVVASFSDKKAIAVPVKSLIPNSEFNANFIRFEPLRIKSALLLGNKDFKSVMSAYFINDVHAVVYSLLKEYKPYADYRGDVFLSDNGEYGILLDIKLAFCTLILIEIAAKKIIGSILEYAKRKFG